MISNTPPARATLRYMSNGTPTLHNQALFHPFPHGARALYPIRRPPPPALLEFFSNRARKAKQVSVPVCHPQKHTSIYRECGDLTVGNLQNRLGPTKGSPSPPLVFAWEERKVRYLCGKETEMGKWLTYLVIDTVERLWSTVGYICRSSYLDRSRSPKTLSLPSMENHGEKE